MKEFFKDYPFEIYTTSAILLILLMGIISTIRDNNKINMNK